MSRKLKIFITLQSFVTLVYMACFAGFFDPDGQCFIVFDQWADFTKWNVGIYSVGNVGEHVSKNLNPKPNEPIS